MLELKDMNPEFTMPWEEDDEDGEEFEYEEMDDEDIERATDSSKTSEHTH